MISGSILQMQMHVPENELIKNSYTKSTHLVYFLSIPLTMWLSLIIFGWLNKTNGTNSFSTNRQTKLHTECSEKNDPIIYDVPHMNQQISPYENMS